MQTFKKLPKASPNNATVTYKIRGEIGSKSRCGAYRHESQITTNNAPSFSISIIADKVPLFSQPLYH